MRDNTEMPAITFGEGTDYESLFALLHFANKGLGGHGGFIFDIHIAGGGVVTGEFHISDEDDMVIALHNEDRAPTDEYATVDADLVEELVYL